MRILTRMSVVAIITFVAAVVFLTSTPASTSAGNWPQWRGPEGQGVSAETGLPDEWSATRNIKWKTAIAGRGHSSPIVWRNKIFLTTALDGDVIPGAKRASRTGCWTELTLFTLMPWARIVSTPSKSSAVDRETGRIIWERVAYEGAVADSRHKKASFASSTPATDGKYVFAFFGTEGLYAYDYNGKQVWKQNLGTLGTASVGYGVSPILYGDLVIMQCDDSGGKSFIAAFDKKTGKQAWRAERKVDVTWSSARTGSRWQTHGVDRQCCGGHHRVRSGDRQRTLEAQGVGEQRSAHPVVSHDLVVVTSGSPKKIALALKAGGSGDVTGTSKLVWSYNKGTAYVPSPILYGDYLYLMTGNGSISCLQANTGKVEYEGARVPKPTMFMASPVAYDGKILLTSEEGDTFVLKAGPKHEVLRTNSLGEPVYASPAIADGKIFIRGEQNIYCIGE